MESQFINRYISFLYRCGQCFFKKNFLQLGLMEINPGLLPVLMQIYRHPGISQDCISKNAGIDKGTTARAVKQLQSIGWATRCCDSQDRRINRVYPTGEALKHHDRVMQSITNLHDILYQGFSKEEIDESMRLIRRMKDNISRYLDMEK